MKLYRLINSDQKLTFDGDIQGNVILPPNSKVALLNANWKNTVRQIELSDGNNSEVIVKMNFTPNTNHEYKFNLEPGVYTTNSNSINQLLQNFKGLLNSVMNYIDENNEKALGLKWEVNYSESSNKVKISTNQQNIIDPVIAIDELPSDSEFNYIKNNILDVNGDNTLYRSATAGVSEIYSRSAQFPISYGGFGSEGYLTMNAVWQCSINELSGGSVGGIIGVVCNPTDDRSDPSNYEYGISWTGLGYEYQIIENGVSSPSGITPNIVTDSDDNDFLQIRMTNNKIEVVIYNDTIIPKENVLVSEVFTNCTLFPSLYLKDNNTTIKNLSVIPLIVGEPLNVIYKTLDTNFDIIEPYTEPIIWEIEMSEVLSDFLGFEFPFLGGEKENFSATSENVRIYEGSDAYIVEMNNLQLDSYDTMLQQRKSILNVITNENNDQNFRYEASNPIFIDINNNFPIPLRNLNLKVLDDKYQEIENEGNANLTILFD